MTHDDNDVRDALRPTRVPMPDDVDRRLRERLAHGSTTLSQQPHPLWSQIQVPLLVACGVLVAGGSIWLASKSPQPEEDPTAHRAAGQGAASPPGPQDPVPRKAPPRAAAPQVVIEERAPLAAILATAPETLESTTRLAVVRITDGKRAEILRWVSEGVDAAEGSGRPVAGETVWILPQSANAAEDTRSFVERVVVGETGQPGHDTWIVNLDHPALSNQEPQPDAKPAPTLRGLPVPAAPLPDGALPGDRLQHELLAGMASPKPLVQRSASLALLTWNGLQRDDDGLPDDGSLWAPLRHEGVPVLSETKARLLALAHDPDPMLRRTLATIVPGYAGRPGHNALYRLAFDPVARVRQQAVLSLRRFDDLELNIRTSTWWTLFSDPPTWDEWRPRFVDAAMKEGLTDCIGVWKRQLDKGKDPNMLAGIIGLGELDEAAGIALLKPLATHENPDVRAAAAHSRLLRGDQGAWADLSKMVKSSESQDLIPALDMVRRHHCMEGLDILDEASRSKDPAIRGLAAAGMASLRDLAEHRVNARLKDLADDEDQVVRRLIEALRDDT